MNARLLLPAGLGLILLSNAVALAGVWYNRQGEPQSRLLLSERELHRDWDGPRKENSGLTMRLDWRMAPQESAEEDDHCYNDRSLSEAQLQAVGLPSKGPEPRQDTRRAWAVLELDGPAYQRSLQLTERHLQQQEDKLEQLPNDKAAIAQAKAAREALQNERSKESRLFIVDVGLDAEALRQRYPDRSRHALLRSTVRVWQRCYNADDKRLSGSVDLHSDSINVPHAWRQQLANRLPEYYGNASTPFTAEVSIGQRFEPWISTVRIAEKPASASDEGDAAR